ncbi:hypothetical protein ACFPTO_04455 [Paraburkholderia denitrificans]|uniref:AraC family transcriptional regulator n=1 Tax=Paraburkholderia denitrificans TaxID=694025 RepID=A0ABW0J4T6_9BURK
MELTNVRCPVWPDAQELRMLRALVQEGLEASREGPYAAQFHGWCIRIFRLTIPLTHSAHVEIRSRDGAAWSCVASGKICYIDGEVV